MSVLLVLTLLCPDTAYYNEPFPVRIERSEPAPPGASSPPDWEARSGLAGIVGQGTVPMGADSLRPRIEGPGAYLGDGARVSIALGTYDPRNGRIKAVPGVECMTVMKIRKATGISARKSTGVRARLSQVRPVGAMRVDGRAL